MKLNRFNNLIPAVIVSLIFLTIPNLQATTDHGTKQSLLHRIQVLQHYQSLRSSNNTAILKHSSHFQHPAGILVMAQGSIAGTVTGLDRDAIGAAFVEAYTADSTGGVYGYYKGLAFVAPDGSYQIDSLAAGNYYVFAWADGYVMQYYNNALDMTLATRVAVRAGEITRGIDFNMEKIVPGTGSIAGRVVRDPDQEPIGLAYISAFSYDYPYFYGWAETGIDGSYRITGLKTGRYYVSVWAEGYLPEYYDNAITIDQATTVEVIEPNETGAIDFALSRGASISGTVRTIDGTPMPGVYLEAMTVYFDSTIVDTGRVDSTWCCYYGKAISDSNGNYTISGLPGGNYWVRAETWSKWTYVVVWYKDASSITDATPVAVKLGEEITGIDFRLEVLVSSGVIAGKVTDSQGEAVANAYIQAQSIATGSDRPMIWAYAVTDHDGCYNIPELPDDGYQVSAWAQSGWQFVQRWWPDAETIDGAQPVIVHNGATAGPIDFQLPLVRGSALIAGYAKSADGQNLTGASIYISPVGAGGKEIYGLQAYGYTDSTGYYQVEQLPAGSYVAYCCHWNNDRFGQQWYHLADSSAAATPITLVDGEKRTDINFSLTLKPMFGSITGTVLDSITGLPINRAYIQITAQYQDLKMNFRYFYNWCHYAISDANGKYRVDGLWEGKYTIAVFSSGAFEYYDNAIVAELATPVTVTGGDTLQVNFAMVSRNDGPGSISGKVASEWENTPFDIALVTAKPAPVSLNWPESEMCYSAVTNIDGSYELKGLPAGDYYVMSFAPYAMPEFYDGVYDPAQATLVKVDGINPTTAINFNLGYMYFFRNNDFGKEIGNSALITGRVTNANGQPLAGANVYLLNGADQAIAAAQTDANGCYELVGIPLGNYVVQVSKVGYTTLYNGTAESYVQAIPVQVGNGVVEINFVLAEQTPTAILPVDDHQLPGSIELYGNYPNPFNPETRISFALPEKTHIRVRIFNIYGAQVLQLFDEVMPAGRHTLTWNGSNQTGQPVSSGIYIYRLEASSGSFTGKMILLR